MKIVKYLSLLIFLVLIILLNKDFLSSKTIPIAREILPKNVYEGLKIILKPSSVLSIRGNSLGQIEYLLLDTSEEELGISKSIDSIFDVINNSINNLNNKIYNAEKDNLKLNEILVSGKIEFRKKIDTTFNIENQFKSKFNYFELNSNFPGKTGVSKNTNYIESYKGNLIVVSATGVFSFTNLENFTKSSGNLKMIKSNISEFINYDEFYSESMYGIKDIYIEEDKIYISYTNQLRNSCYNTSILVADFNFDYLDFKSFFKDNECIEVLNEYGEFNALESGGRITGFNDKELLFSIGDYRYRTKAQDDKSLFGKIVSINKNSSEVRVISKGHRNVQGLKYIKDLNMIVSSEHGPRGGDEVNIQMNIDSIHNYGWPVSSYGEHYISNTEILKEAPLHKSHIDFGFTEPFKYFVPSIGVSEIEYLKFNNNFYLLVTSMGYNSKEGKMSIHIIDLLDREKPIIMNFEKRIRDIISVDKKTFFISFETFGGIGILNF